MTDEHIDPEKRFLLELASIEEFKEGVKALEAQVEDLTRRVESLELMGFQDQLDRLNEQVTKTSEALLENERAIAYLNTSFCTENIHGIINAQFPGNMYLIAQLFANASATKKAIESSKTPLTISYAFYEQWLKTLREMGAKTVTY